MKYTEEELNKLYDEVGKLIWSIFPKSGIEAYFYAKIYDESSQRKFYWLDSNGDEAWHDFDNSPNEITYQIVEKLEQLQKHKLFEKEPWTHCKVTLSDKGELDIKFSYIKEENSWPGLYMKGLNEISYEEALQYCSVPKEEWEKRQ